MIHQEENKLPSVTQLGRTLTQWNYRIKNKKAAYQQKSNQKVILNSYEEAEQHFQNVSLTKRMLCSLLHNFYDPSHTLLPQTMLFSRFTWKALHDSGNIGWDDQIPLEIINLTKLTLYSFFLESSKEMPR